jgi:signal peptidase II
MACSKTFQKMKTTKRATIIFLIVISCVGCDQVTKTIAKHTLPKFETFSFLNDTLRLQYAENQGAFLSLGATIPENIRYLILTCLVAGFTVTLLAYLLKSKGMKHSTTAALSLILAGGTGNLIDRIFNKGRVIDFLNMGIGPIRTGVFNIADIAITIGTLWLIFLMIRHGKNEKTI